MRKLQLHGSTKATSDPHLTWIYLADHGAKKAHNLYHRLTRQRPISFRGSAFPTSSVGSRFRWERYDREWDSSTSAQKSTGKTKHRPRNGRHTSRDLSGPVPQPRSRAAVVGKAPVPLPRTIVNVNKAKSRSAGSSKEDVDPNRNSTPPSAHAYSSLTRAKIKLRRVTSNVQERSSAVLESTRNVSHKLENSVRNILSKRLTTLGIPDEVAAAADKPTEDDFLKSQSLPAADVFQSISFGSPLASEDIYVPCDDNVKSLPPPSYPPPPLPDESIYDELVSAKSGSSVLSGYVPMRASPDSPAKSTSHYEELPIPKKDDSSCWETMSDTSSMSGAACLPQEPRHERADSCKSWKFYDIVHGFNKTKIPGPCYENVAVDENYVEAAENIYSGEPTRVRLIPETEGSTNECLVPKKIDHLRPDRDSELSGSTGSRSSTSNDLYENWKLPGEDQVDAEDKRSSLSRSVIYEFDPLFEERQRQRLEQKRMLELEELAQEADIYAIPEPPARIDSLPDSDSSNTCNEEYLMYHRVAMDNHAFADIEESQKDLPALPKEGRKLSSLVRWTSMKRAIKTLKDGTPWSPVLARKTSRGKDCVSQKPLQSPHSGYILKSPSNGEKPKDFVSRWCLLSEGKLLLAPDKNSTNKEIIPLDNILSIRIISTPRLGSDGENVHCWEVSAAGRAKPHVFGTTSQGDAKMWMRKLLESLTNVFPSKLTADFSKAGQCFLKVIRGTLYKLVFPCADLLKQEFALQFVSNFLGGRHSRVDSCVDSPPRSRTILLPIE
ncbi:unnamed protein product [Nesidiocoris tenuis]|uniref:PH domain-containing protein n=1 Tax=Nesidiocoris tenuis TaxID=355587 RepID=A0A6H5GSA1_9HEMI|nr:unnamed protein product [Nesidiocoris tenuis]